MVVERHSVEVAFWADDEIAGCNFGHHVGISSDLLVSRRSNRVTPFTILTVLADSLASFGNDGTTTIPARPKLERLLVGGPTALVFLHTL